MVQFSNGQALVAMAIALVPTIWKPDHSKSRLSRISDFRFLYLFYFQWPVGLKNVGQTCWFSAVIQSLFYLPAFRSLVLNYRPLDTATLQIDEDSNKRPPTSAFADRQRKIVEFMQVRRHRLITRESSIQGEGALPLVQLSINFKLSCWKRRKQKLCFSKQLIKKLIANCTSDSAPSPCI